MKQRKKHFQKFLEKKKFLLVDSEGNTALDNLYSLTEALIESRNQKLYVVEYETYLISLVKLKNLSLVPEQCRIFSVCKQALYITQKNLVFIPSKILNEELALLSVAPLLKSNFKGFDIHMLVQNIKSLPYTLQKEIEEEVYSLYEDLEPVFFDKGFWLFGAKGVERAEKTIFLDELKSAFKVKNKIQIQI